MYARVAVLTDGLLTEVCAFGIRAYCRTRMYELDLSSARSSAKFTLGGRRGAEGLLPPDRAQPLFPRRTP